MGYICNSIWQLLLLSASVFAQTIEPSNSTALSPATLYPRFDVNASGSLHFPSFQVAPLAQYAAMSRQYFLTRRINGVIVQTSPANANDVRSTDISYISCDVEDYNSNIGPVELISIIGSMGVRNSIVLYTRTANHCDVNGFMSNYLPKVNGIFTTLDPVIAAQIADYDFGREANAQAHIVPDADSYTDPNAPLFNSTANAYDAGPTTAVAMIVLYTITGIITALFISIIVTGAVRAHRHPERYGPRRGSNAQGGQSRAKGIARALLETIPIIRFGDQQKGNVKKENDVELTTTSTSTDSKEPSTNVRQNSSTTGTAPIKSESPVITSTSNADGSDEQGVLGCSICTEEFQQGQEVRVLPCNHKFHPDCVDPWLLNVSGTCPLCRVDLRGSIVEDSRSTVVQPLSGSANTSHTQALRAALTGTREERIAALRRFRIERRSRGEPVDEQQQNEEEERRGLARRLTDRFRIRTRRHQVGESAS